MLPTSVCLLTREPKIHQLATYIRCLFTCTDTSVRSLCKHTHTYTQNKTNTKASSFKSKNSRNIYSFKNIQLWALMNSMRMRTRNAAERSVQAGQHAGPRALASGLHRPPGPSPAGRAQEGPHGRVGLPTTCTLIPTGIGPPIPPGGPLPLQVRDPALTGRQDSPASSGAFPPEAWETQSIFTKMCVFSAAAASLAQSALQFFQTHEPLGPGQPSHAEGAAPAATCLAHIQRSGSARTTGLASLSWSRPVRSGVLSRDEQLKPSNLRLSELFNSQTGFDLR